MKVAYVDKRFRESSLALIETMNAIVNDYQRQGFTLSMRQLYYQLVTRNEVANVEREYNRIIRLGTDARMAGLLDWSAIEDRGREFIERARWVSGADILQAAANSYHQDRWINQAFRVFVIVEKAALSGVLSPTCHDLDIPLLAAIGYPSVSVLREFAVTEIIPAMDDGQDVIVLHLADHDPSGIDMTRDLRERLSVFIGEAPDVQRIALNLDQVKELNPPENPAKQTDCRFADYARRFGHSSWELDALPPDYLARLVREHAAEFIDPDSWAESEREVAEVKARLDNVIRDWMPPA